MVRPSSPQRRDPDVPAPAVDPARRPIAGGPEPPARRGHRRRARHGRPDARSDRRRCKASACRSSCGASWSPRPASCRPSRPAWPPRRATSSRSWTTTPKPQTGGRRVCSRTTTTPRSARSAAAASTPRTTMDRAGARHRSGRLRQRRRPVRRPHVLPAHVQRPGRGRLPDGRQHELSPGHRRASRVRHGAESQRRARATRSTSACRSADMGSRSSSIRRSRSGTTRRRARPSASGPPTIREHPVVLRSTSCASALRRLSLPRKSVSLIYQFADRRAASARHPAPRALAARAPSRL